MQTLLKTAVIAVILFTCASCITLDTELSLNKDGSGTLSMEYAITESSVAQIKGMLALERDLALAAGDPAPTHDENDLIRMMMNPVDTRINDHLKSYSKHGVTLEKIEFRSRESSMQIETILAFNSLEDLSKTDIFQQFGFSLGIDKEGNYVLQRSPHNRAAESFDPLDSEEAKTLVSLLGGMHITLKIITPGRVLKTTADDRRSFSAEWRFDFDRDPNILANIQKQYFLVVFEGEGVDLPPIAPRQSE